MDSDNTKSPRKWTTGALHVNGCQQGIKQTCPFALHVSASDPKRILRQFGIFQYANLNRYAALIRSLGAHDEAARVCCACCLHGGDVAALGRSPAKIASYARSKYAGCGQHVAQGLVT